MKILKREKINLSFEFNNKINERPLQSVIVRT